MPEASVHFFVRGGEYAELTLSIEGGTPLSEADLQAALSEQVPNIKGNLNRRETLNTDDEQK